MSFCTEDIVIAGLGGLYPKVLHLENFEKLLFEKGDHLGSRWKEGMRFKKFFPVNFKVGYQTISFFLFRRKRCYESNRHYARYRMFRCRILRYS